MTTLRLATPDLELDLAPLGARVHRLRVRAPDGAWRDTVLHLDRVADHLDSPSYLGATVGRCANRIAGGLVQIDGMEHRLSRNEGPHTLHGGADGFDRRTWSVVSATAARAELALRSPHGDQGFPGNVEVRAVFEVTGRELTIGYTATTDAPTVVSLTAHPYFRLSGTTAEDHVLTVPASRYLPVTDEGVPTGEQAAVTGTAYDLRRGRSVSSLVEDVGGLDHCFLVQGSGLREVARLEAGGLAMTLVSDQPGLQVFTGGAFCDDPFPRWAGVALEPQLPPDAVHHPQWPSPVLRPGETYSWRSVVRFARVD